MHGVETLTTFICTNQYGKIVIALKPESITMTITNKASCNCTNLGIPPVNMNVAEGNISISITCETQPPNNEEEIYLLSFQYSSFEK